MKRWTYRSGQARNGRRERHPARPAVDRHGCG